MGVASHMIHVMAFSTNACKAASWSKCQNKSGNHLHICNHQAKWLTAASLLLI